MRNMSMCPMMAHMPMMQQTMPMQMYNPMCMHMPVMEQMVQPMAMEDMHYEMDERDEEYFESMHSDVCRKMMPYVMRTVDKMEQKGDMIYEDRPRREMVDRMVDEAYNDLVRDMPDMADEMGEERQFGRRRFVRDILGLLLINQLLRRRRRRRRRRDFDFDHDYDYDNDYFFND